MPKMNQETVLQLVREIEKIMVEEEADYVNAFAAALYVACVSANNIGMSKTIFLANCETLFDHDKKEQLKELQ
jgi:hypothetical protein